MKRSQALDVLRGVAILLVLGYHAPYYRALTIAGWTGVNLFFVLSGFLISGLLFNEYKQRGSIDFPRFFWRRGFKIWPGYYALLVVTAVVHLIAGSPIPGRKLAIAGFFVTDYFNDLRHTIAPLGQIWSLSVEEHFYLILPPLLILLIKLGRGRKDPFRAVPWIFAASVAACLAMRVLFLPIPGWAARTDMVFDALFGGVALSYLRNFRPNLFAHLATTPALLLGVVLAAPTLFFRHETRLIQTLGLPAVTVAFAILLAWSSQRERLFSNPFCGIVAKIGFYSYSIYLWHMFFSPLFLLYRVTALRFWAFAVVSIFVGIAMALLIELPALSLRERLVPVARFSGALIERNDPLVELPGSSSGRCRREGSGARVTVSIGV